MGNGIPTCDDMNDTLDSIWHGRNDAPVPFIHISDSGERYYAVAHSDYRYRACSHVNARVGSGWAGPPNRLSEDYWTPDNSYGGWLAGHELGHTYGRNHTLGAGRYPSTNAGPSPYETSCGTEQNTETSYPSDHVGGRISPSLTGDTAIYGFDAESFAVYGPDSYDIMSYCTYRWLSDYTYNALIHKFQTEPVAQSLRNNSHRLDSSSWASFSTSEQVDRLLLIGTIELSTRQVKLKPILFMPNMEPLHDNSVGDYGIVLRDEFGDILAHYHFQPIANADGDNPHIEEAIPYVNGTVMVDIEGPGGFLLKRIKAGESAPSIVVTSPKNDEILSNDTATVSWTASDPDNDRLTFMVKYSSDNGNTWKVVAQDVTRNSVVVDMRNVPASTHGLFRVLASDGIHTSRATSAPFIVPNHIPTVRIVKPQDNTVVVSGSTLSLIGSAYDLDIGSMGSNQLQWLSNIDGFLGNGDQLSIAKLSIGTHIITFQADDGSGDVASATVRVTVVADPTQFSPIPNNLQASTTSITLISSSLTATSRISIDNQNWLNPIEWNATTSQPWIKLNTVSGTTPSDLSISLDQNKLPSESQEAIITITSPNTPGDSVIISVKVILVGKEHKVWFPILMSSNSAIPLPKVGPDIVGAFSINPNKRTFQSGEPVTITAIVTNKGNAAADPFWVDLFINPSSPPTSANVIWNNVCGLQPCFGIAWAVRRSLAPGESVVLTSTVDSLEHGNTRWPGWFAKGTTDLYLYVDSYDLASPNGAVTETDETNNRAEIHGLTVTGTNPAEVAGIDINNFLRRQIAPMR